MQFKTDRIVPVFFRDTVGGTELDLQLDSEPVPSDDSKSQKDSATVAFEGSLTLDDVPVRAKAEIVLDTMTGWCQLFPTHNSDRDSG